ncbi:Copia protein [Sarcoptes scabiei]|uniref:Copia protein n=2 Tax=Sarcoptes scabiei TaxID=52283 RepID=A0A834RC22_SARSC|nr:Copia protein [Sarcoptes scabiei]
MESECASSYRFFELTANNYLAWRSKALLEISSRDATEAIESDLEFVTDKSGKRKDKDASRIINSNVGLVDADRILSCRSAFQKWKYLEENYQKSASNRSLELLMRYEQMPSNGSWVDILTARKEILDQLDLIYRLNCGENADRTINKMKCDWFMLKLPASKFQPVISAFQAMDDSQKKFGKLFNDAMVIAQGSIGDDCVRNCEEKNVGFVARKKKNLVKCYNCGKIGHIKRNCKISDTDEASNKDFGQYFVNCVNNYKNQCQKWILDSGANVHTVIVTGSGRVNVLGRGCVNLGKDYNGREWVIKDVLFSPKFKCNIISVPKLLDEGYEVNFGKKWTRIQLNSINVVMARRNNDGLIEVPSLSNFVNVSWHRRLGHCCEEKLKKLGFKEKVGKCEVCCTNKQKRNNFSTVPPITEVLGRIHSDVCGPFTDGIGKKKYFVTFIDECSRFCRAVAIGSRTEIFEEFKDFVNWAENQTNQRVKSFVSDNAKEYRSEVFRKYCSEKGIEMLATSAYCPEQNGISERKNQSIMSMTRCLLNEKNLPKILWPYAIAYASFLQNRIPSNAIQGKSPYEVFFNRKPNLQKIRVFGSLVSVMENHVPDKLTPRARLAVLIGVLEKVYVLFDPASEKVFQSRNVKIFEDDKFDFSGLSKYEETSWPIELLDHDYLPKSFLMIEDSTVPINYDDAMRSNDKEDWNSAIIEETESLRNHEVYEEVEFDNQRFIDTKWVFTEKRDANGLIVRRKARLVAKGFSQRVGIDFDETYAPVCEKNSLRIMLTLAAVRNWCVHHLDIKTAFLNGNLEEEVYVRPPHPLRKEGKIWKLKKSLYGLKQSPRNWHKFLNDILINNGFMASKTEPCLYLKEDCLLLVYVDDILVSSKDIETIESVKILLAERVEVHDLKEVNKFLNINICKRDGQFLLDQESYIMQLAEKFGQKNCRKVCQPLPSGIGELSKVKKDPNCVRPIRCLLGALLYIANVTRPDISASVSFLSRFTEQPSELLWKSLCQVLRFLVWTSDRKLCLGKRSEKVLELYVDSDFASDVVTRKSQTGFIIKLYGSSILWVSKKQSTISLSSSEAEYVALASGVSSMLGVMNLLKEIGLTPALPLPVFEDNQPCISMAETGTRVKHIDVKYHFIRELIERQIIVIKYISTQEQVADVLTKTNPKGSFDLWQHRLGLITTVYLKPEPFNIFFAFLHVVYEAMTINADGTCLHCRSDGQNSFKTMSNLKILVKEVEDQINELIDLKSQAKLSSIKDFLQNEINRLTVSKQNLDRQISSSLGGDSKVAKEYQPGSVTVSNYMWDQTNDYVKIYITLDKNEEIESDDISLKFESSTKFTCVFGKYRFTLSQLHQSIDQNKSKAVLSKSNKLIITLVKSKPENWSSLQAKPNAPQPKIDDDPQNSLMTLMKKMYDEGDDDMKRTIAKSWYESQQKKNFDF